MEAVRVRELLHQVESLMADAQLTKQNAVLIDKFLELVLRSDLLFASACRQVVQHRNAPPTNVSDGINKPGGVAK